VDTRGCRACCHERVSRCPKLPVNPSEARLLEIAERSFLKLWSYANPHRARGKEIADLLVVFGNDLVIFSDKQSTYRDDSHGWRRWYRRTITESIKQLSGAYRFLSADTPAIYVDDRASRAFPFKLPASDQCRIHLVAVARVAREGTGPNRWTGLQFDNTISGFGKPFCLGPLKVQNHLVHVFDAETLEAILAELDTISDFIWYLNRRERAIATPNACFRELDLLMLSLFERSEGQWGLLLDVNDESGIPEGLWTDAYSTECRIRSQRDNRPSYTIDKLIEFFHAEYIENRLLQDENFPFAAHEQALRYLASENRFSRRIIATELFGILDEPDQSTFWAVTVESFNAAGIRYVWLVYPPTPTGMDDDAVGSFLVNYLKDHVYVARSIFAASLIIGVAVPNRSIAKGSYLLVVFDGTHWTENAQKGAEELRAKQGIFANIEAVTRRHIR
jgi:hypothetical protein